jgi:NitT/TauT family transport system ATP-binding protein/nitrate/nitrite transport system substrate-binding protein
MTVRIGLLRLNDSLPVLVAAEGLFAAEGVAAVELSVEPSWANLADKLAFGLLDAAVMLHPLALAMAGGLRGPAAAVGVPMGLSRGGNSLVLSPAAAEACGGAVGVPARAAGFVGWLRGQQRRPRLAAVHVFSSHHLLLRDFIVAGGGVPDRDAELVVLPPEQVVGALGAGEIAGFCAGAPWGDLADDANVGKAVLGSTEMWQGHPEKCLAVRSAWAVEQPEACEAVLRALERACRAGESPADSGAWPGLLAGIGVAGPAAAVGASLPGGEGRERIVFGAERNAAILARDGAWLLERMGRAGLLPAGLDRDALLGRVYGGAGFIFA